MADPLPAEWDLPPHLRQEFGHEEGNMRAIADGENLLLLLAEVPVEGDTDRQQVIYHWNERCGWQCAVDGLDEHPLKLIRAYEATLETIEDRLEHAQTADQVYALLDELVPFTRTGRGLHRTFAEARTHFPAERQFALLRDRAAGIERLADHLLQDARHALSYIAARQAERQAAAAQRLNRMVLFFLPLTAVSGVFGMNVPNLLEHHPSAFPILVASALGFGLLLVAVFWDRNDGRSARG